MSTEIKAHKPSSLSLTETRLKKELNVSSWTLKVGVTQSQAEKGHSVHCPVHLEPPFVTESWALSANTRKMSQTYSLLKPQIKTHKSWPGLKSSILWLAKSYLDSVLMVISTQIWENTEYPQMTLSTKWRFLMLCRGALLLVSSGSLFHLEGWMLHMQHSHASEFE